MAHLYGPAARCKPKVMIWRSWVLRFCIRPLSGTFVFLAIMDIRARSISFASRPRRPYWPPDHERAGETSSFRLADLGGKANFGFRGQPAPSPRSHRRSLARSGERRRAAAIPLVAMSTTLGLGCGPAARR